MPEGLHNFKQWREIHDLIGEFCQNRISSGVGGTAASHASPWSSCESDCGQRSSGVLSVSLCATVQCCAILHVIMKSKIHADVGFSRESWPTAGTHIYHSIAYCRDLTFPLNRR